jgi:hypothetical protein
MGYPAGTIAADPKAARLAEAFGIQGKEAWEDFGMEHAVEEEPEGEGGLLGPRRGMNRQQRDAKSASVWDMEETLKSGKPVPSGQLLATSDHVGWILSIELMSLRICFQLTLPSRTFLREHQTAN